MQYLYVLLGFALGVLTEHLFHWFDRSCGWLAKKVYR